MFCRPWRKLLLRHLTRQSPLKDAGHVQMSKMKEGRKLHPDVIEKELLGPKGKEKTGEFHWRLEI